MPFDLTREESEMAMVEKYVRKLGMQYLEGEGGYFAEIYRAEDQKLEIRHATSTMCPTEAIPHDKKDGISHRHLYTTIYYLMEKRNAPCTNKSDHIHFFHDGCPIKYYWLDMENRKLHWAILGSNLSEGHHFQLLVPRGTLKWAEVLDDGINDRYSLISECTMPGFEFQDRTLYSKEELKSMFPEFWEDIEKGFS